MHANVYIYVHTYIKAKNVMNLKEDRVMWKCVR